MADSSPFTKIAVMQLFYELKQKFPTVPDYVVSDCIQQNSCDKEICNQRLEEEHQNYQLHSYPSGIVDKMTEGKEKYRPKSLSIPPPSPKDNNNNNSQFFIRRGFGRQSLDSRISNRFPKNIVDTTEEPPNVSIVKDVPKKITSGKRFDSLSVNDIHTATTTTNTSTTITKPDKIITSNCYGGSVPINLNVDQCRIFENTNMKDIKISSNEKDLFVSDLKFHFCNDNHGSERTSVRVKYKKSSGSYSEPSTPSGNKHFCCTGNNNNNNYQCNNSDKIDDDDENNNNHMKRTSSLYIDNLGPVGKISEPKRPFTSVNLTLRLPSLSGPQAPIDISSKGSKLTYSSCSFDAKNGYQNELEICIQEEGSSMSASRVKTSPIIPNPKSNLSSSSSSSTSSPHLDTNIPPIVRLKLQEQIEAKRRLERDLENETKKLEKIQKDVTLLEREIERRQRMPVSQRVIQLRNEVRALQLKCNEMVNKIDGATETSVVLLGEINEDFYNNISMTSQDITCDPPSSVSQTAVGGGDNGNWTCHMCTFRNHPMLPKCEQCEMARVDLSNALANILRPQATNATASHRLSLHPKV